MRGKVVASIRRREFFAKFAFASTALGLIIRAAAKDQDVQLSPTPANGKQLELTDEETSGPFFRPSSPLKTNFREAGVPGKPITLTGLVLDPQGNPVRGCLLDFWHANGDGQYDLDGFLCRGHQFSDAQGRYSLKTVVPGLYPGRTRHFHARFQAPGESVKSTQLYFPGELRNAEDMLFRSDLLMQLSSDKSNATFNFVTETTR
ncbi:MAG: intradiol ring-cleavage dioxygenase [Verrucomicrobia bacterium]|nr:intradiol ring-cleavage dioxygenase [Verrucomicrobiota bacterium]